MARGRIFWGKNIDSLYKETARNEARHILGSNNFNDVEQIFEERRFYKMLENSHEAMVTVDRCPEE